ncbi:diacylglycerol kinase family protein [uncultured Arcticibacterium sp.]|uniref:diacylglycerol kinase family protein n=1 Tax=uncultured Arcticibacterium sp. TaxID=2173042 RepID=UPI0030FAE678
MNINKMVKSFGFASKGFSHLLRSENNFQFHFLAAVLVFICGFWLKVSRIEWAILIIQIGLVFSAEAFNTALEILCDVVSPDWNEKIGKVKDVAAAGVLIVAVVAVAVAILILGNRFITLYF